MIELRGLRRRLGGAIVVAVAGVLAVSGVAAADSESGQHGNYLFPDSSSKPRVVCVYAGTSQPHLTQLIVKPPSVWWWDTNSDNNRQHGKVGWRAIVQVSTAGAYGPWSLLKKSGVQKATAYEDRPAYDEADKAPFTKRTLSIDSKPYKSEQSTYVRVILKAYWYRSNGSIAGQASHTTVNYKWRNNPLTDVSTTACLMRYIPN